MKTSLFKVKLQDLFQAGVNAALAAVIVGLAGIVGTDNFDVFNADWAGIGHNVINWASAAFLSSVGKDFFTTKEGNLLGVVKVK